MQYTLKSASFSHDPESNQVLSQVVYTSKLGCDYQCVINEAGKVLHTNDVKNPISYKFIESFFPKAKHILADNIRMSIKIENGQLTVPASDYLADAFNTAKSFVNPPNYLCNQKKV